MTAPAHSTSSCEGHAVAEDGPEEVTSTPRAFRMLCRSSVLWSIMASSRVNVGLPCNSFLRLTAVHINGCSSLMMSRSGNISIHSSQALPPSDDSSRYRSRSCNNFSVSACHSVSCRAARPTLRQKRASSAVSMAERGTRTMTSPAGMARVVATAPKPRSGPSHRTWTPRRSNPSCEFIHNSNAAPRYPPPRRKLGPRFTAPGLGSSLKAVARMASTRSSRVIAADTTTDVSRRLLRVALGVIVGEIAEDAVGPPEHARRRGHACPSPNRNSAPARPPTAPSPPRVTTIVLGVIGRWGVAPKRAGWGTARRQEM
mmetsp:Transcript_19129/g.47410  ORF Transcript_19129/g.47410 Transcript_19129/m.47410 type:complete len:314 (-) Transcript_19129:416-1357(-)